jgi:RNA polymerase sigma-70 factor (ECF subfamily)
MIRFAGLALSFCGNRRAIAEGPGAALDAALLDFWERGRAASPGVPLEADALAAYLGELAPAEADPLDYLSGLRAEDLFLACACAMGLREAIRAFDAVFLVKLDVYLRALGPTPEIIAETKQLLLEKLFVGRPGRPPKIRQYGGHGPLEGWVRVAAVRVALNLTEAERALLPRPDEADAIARAVVPDGDPELELVRATYQHEFVAAFRAAIAGLSRRDRTLLRFTFVEHLTPAEIGAMYGVHRTTAMRWIASAQEEILARTRSGMMDRLRISPSECDRVLSLVRTRIDHTINSLLATA